MHPLFSSTARRCSPPFFGQCAKHVPHAPSHRPGPHTYISLQKPCSYCPTPTITFVCIPHPPGSANLLQAQLRQELQLELAWHIPHPTHTCITPPGLPCSSCSPGIKHGLAANRQPYSEAALCCSRRWAGNASATLQRMVLRARAARQAAQGWVCATLVDGDCALRGHAVHGAAHGALAGKTRDGLQAPRKRSHDPSSLHA